MNIPQNLRYTQDHEWARIEGDLIVIGVTDYAQSELGDIVYVDIDMLDEDLDAAEVFGSIEAVKTVSDLFMPIAGIVVAVNDNLEDSPEVINSDPYGEGWIV
ncbi:MAG: glycine cleavage system protein GcvH, partial [Chitinophagales bacterium]